MASNFFAYSEQPQFSTQVQVKQKFKIDGFKFFQETLNMIKDIIYTSEKQPSKTIPASGLAAFLGAHALCHETGILPADFNIKMLETVTGVKYDSIRKGFWWCVQKGWIIKVVIDDTVHYKITDYEKLNNSAAERPRYGEEEHKLSYFRVPKAVFSSGILNVLVHNKDTAGIVTLLRFCNHFSRQLKNSKDNISDYDCIRYMSHLKTALRRKAHKVREYLNNVIKKIFNITFDGIQERKPRTREDRKRKPVVQLVVEKVKLVLTNICAKVNDDLKKIDEKTKNFAKNIADALRYAGRSITKKDMKDIQNVFRSEAGLIMSYMERETDRDALHHTLLGLVCRDIDHQTNRIQNVGGFIRDAIRNAIDEWKKTPEIQFVVHDVAVRYYHEHNEYPAFISRN